MATAKDIRLAPVSSRDAGRLVKRVHYSGRVVNNSQLHLGVFLGGRLEGAMQFGPPLDRRKLLHLVTGTAWNEFMELNRMAFSERLPRNSESRALGVAMRLLRRHYPHLKWVVSFADGTQCGDGTIYRAAGFVLTGMSKGSLWMLPPDLAEINGAPVAHLLKVQDKGNALSREILQRCQGKNLTIAKCAKLFGGRVMPGFQFRYLYFLDPSARQRLTVPVIPFSRIDDIGGGMYRGLKRSKQAMAGTTGTAAGQHRPERSKA